MIELEAQVHYRIARDGDDRRDPSVKGTFVNALRWWGPTDGDPGRAALRQLLDGDTLSPGRMASGLAWLEASIAYYATAPEPYDGRNAEARHDLRELLDALVRAQAEAGAR